MVRQWAVLGLLLASCSALAAPLTATLDRRQSTLGEPLVLRLEAAGEAALEQLDLSALSTDFEVFSVTHASTGAGRSARSHLEATLYPVRTGTLTVPPLHVGSQRSKAIEMAVQDDPDLALRVQFTPDELHERQQALLTIEIRDGADRPWTRPERLDIPGLLLRPLPEVLREETFEGPAGTQRITVRELRWTTITLKAGHYAPRLPMLEAYRLGTRLRVPVPPAALGVSALPAYLPVAVPVGKPVLETSAIPQQARVGEPFEWTLRVGGDGITVDGLKQLLRLPQGERDGLHFYAAQYASDEADADGKRALKVVIPVVPTRTGETRLSALALPYFDPQTQRIEHARLSARTVAVSDPFWRRAALGAAGILLAIVAGWATWFGRREWRRRAARKAALERIARAGTAQELADAVCDFARAPQAATLRQWLTRARKPQGFVDLVDELEQACFGPVPAPDVGALKQRWLAALDGARLT